MIVDDLQYFENLHLSSEEEMAWDITNNTALPQWPTSLGSSLQPAIVFPLEPHNDELWHASDFTLASHKGLSQFIEDTPSMPFGNQMSMNDIFESLDSQLHTRSEIPRSPEAIISTQSKGQGPGQHVFAISMPKR
jgi:hypothetical protein